MMMMMMMMTLIMRIIQTIQNEENENIREVYVTNRNHIKDYHHEGDLRHVYNFSTNNLNDGYAEIRRHLNDIYDDLNVTYRINFAFGMILFNNQTGEYRYYIPYFNSRILTYPFTVSNRNSLRMLMNKILRIDIIEQARAVRPSTAWTLAFITNVQYNVFLTDFPLGANIKLPSYVSTNRYLKKCSNESQKKSTISG